MKSAVPAAAAAVVLTGVSMLSVSAEPGQANMTNIQHSYLFSMFVFGVVVVVVFLCTTS